MLPVACAGPRFQADHHPVLRLQARPHAKCRSATAEAIRCHSPAEHGRVPAAPARCPSTPLESTWSSGEAGLPSLGSSASRPVLTSLIVDPEHLDKSIPVLVGTELSQGGKGLLCFHHVQSGGARGGRIAALRLSKLHVSRYWGCPQSKQRMLELTVPGREEQAGTLHLAMGDYDSLSRLAYMMGREHFD